MHLHGSRVRGAQRAKILRFDGTNWGQTPQETCVEYPREIKKFGSVKSGSGRLVEVHPRQMQKFGSAATFELTTEEIQAERARIEEKSGIKGYDYGNSWAKLV